MASRMARSRTKTPNLKFCTFETQRAIVNCEAGLRQSTRYCLGVQAVKTKLEGLLHV